jgi:hypothetical protein
MFQISALGRDEFAGLFVLDDAALAARGAKRYVANAKPGFPCRVSMEDAEPGERVILVPYCHQPADTPYRASGPVFVREGAVERPIAPGAVPELLRSRVLSLRAYNAKHLMVDADIADGGALEAALGRLFENDRVAYVHVHYAKPGCYACRVDRAPAATTPEGGRA